MASFLLVHGSWHGAWCWDRLAPVLRERGHRADAIDLPGHGEDTTPAWRIKAADYSRAIRDAARSFDEAPILVGHSMGGLAVSQAAADEPDCFASLVYLCAFVPLPVATFLRLMSQDRETLVRTGIRPGPFAAGMRADRAPAIFYGDCDDDAVAWAIDRLCPDPIRPVLEMLGRRRIPLPSTYIECTRDRAIPVALQREMHRRGGFDRIETLESDHSPFLSQPETLASLLDRVATR